MEHRAHPKLSSHRPLTFAALAFSAIAAIPAVATAKDDFTVGFIYVGPKDDWGYNQAHPEGAAVLKKMPGVLVKEQEKVPETVDVQKTMEEMIAMDGAKVVFPTSFGYFDPHILKVAKKFPKTPL